ncbi:hypothetical protein RCG23_02370 [Neobacillus sp. PS3-34]|uniref:DUF5724 domain-containing protein n=1 Tax=Neobacillus sp. PS3-34 TaxID=3070678 RepID=UPI0027DF7E65|nr:hypothetical protein [Neobacillus sp. PS3-34]WML48979.1 hypothetical protein RCG23_02370 [Neobacillus sp. PS3-34]
MMEPIDKQVYFEKLDKLIEENFSGNEQQVARIILKVANSHYYEKQIYMDNIKKSFLAQSSWRDTDFFEPFIAMVRVLLGREYEVFFQYFVNHKYEHSYSTGYMRRPLGRRM